MQSNESSKEKILAAFSICEFQRKNFIEGGEEEASCASPPPPLFSFFPFELVNKSTRACWIRSSLWWFFWAMLRWSSPITPFRLYSQLNPSLKTCSLTLLIFSFGSTSSLTEGSCFRLFVRYYAKVGHWKSYFPHICYGCGGGCGRHSASSGGGSLGFI